jgi:hypothetical protein
MLVLLDRSASTQELFGAVSRLDFAKAALRAAVDSFPDSVQTGVLFFPTLLCIGGGGPTLAGGAVAPWSEPPHLGFAPPDAFLAAWDAHWQLPPPQLLGTPLQEAFDRVDPLIAAGSGSDPRAVVLIADGDGNCLTGPEVGVPTDTTANRAAAWKAAGVLVHVVAFPTANANPNPELDAIAAAAGTAVITPETVEKLAADLRALADGLACDPP